MLFAAVNVKGHNVIHVRRDAGVVLLVLTTILVMTRLFLWPSALSAPAEYMLPSEGMAATKRPAVEGSKLLETPSNNVPLHRHFEGQRVNRQQQLQRWARIFLRGERHSGMSWIRKVLTKNIPDMEYTLPECPPGVGSCDMDSLYDWKHALLPLNLTLDHRDIALFVVRHPLTWLPRMRIHTKSELPMQEFLEAKWSENDDKPTWPNVFAMRTAKYQNWMDFARLRERTELFKFEDWRRDCGKSIVSALCSKYSDLPCKKPIVGSCGYARYGEEEEKSSGELEMPSPEVPFIWQKPQLQLVRSSLNRSLERALGYDDAYDPGRRLWTEGLHTKDEMDVLVKQFDALVKTKNQQIRDAHEAIQWIPKVRQKLDDTRHVTSIRDCAESIATPPAKLDIVIPYRYDPKDASLRYELRSFETHGLLDHIRRVFLVTNTHDEVERLRSVYRHPQMHIVAMDDVLRSKVRVEHPSWEIMFIAPYLPNITNYYLMVPDDVVLLRNYTRSLWFDVSTKRPYAHSFGTSHTGETLGHPNIAPFHGPQFLNRCAMRYVIRRYQGQPIDPVAVAIGEMRKHDLLAGFFLYHDARFRAIAGADFFSECHTNEGCRKTRRFDDVFVNIQGNGVSAEYPEDVAMVRIFRAWFEDTFPIPSRFET